jgi:hypothetical protein
MQEADAEDLEHILTTEPVEFESILFKMPSTAKLFWRAHKRLFKLKENVLWYETPGRTSENSGWRAISLTGAKIVVYVKKKDSKYYYINVSPKSKKSLAFNMYTTDRDLAQEWNSRITNNIQWCNEMKQIEVEQKRRSKRRTSHLGVDLTERPHESELPKSYYEVLGVPPDASTKEIKTTYRKLARDLHPDKNPDIEATDFARIGEAFGVLSDPVKRKQYDLCETVTEALRLGVLCSVIQEGEDVFDPPKEVTLFLDRNLKHLFYQPQIGRAHV